MNTKKERPFDKPEKYKSYVGKTRGQLRAIRKAERKEIKDKEKKPK